MKFAVASLSNKIVTEWHDIVPLKRNGSTERLGGYAIVGK